MIVSMTGFGRGEASADGFALTSEIRAVNSRYLDLSIRLPQEIQEKELDLKELVQAKINRGKLNINIRLNQAQRIQKAAGETSSLSRDRSADHLAKPDVIQRYFCE